MPLPMVQSYRVRARIMGIADIFEALTARDRPYKPAMKIATALRILENMAGRAPPPNPRLADSITVVANLNEQLRRLARRAVSLRRHDAARR